MSYPPSWRRVPDATAALELMGAHPFAHLFSDVRKDLEKGLTPTARRCYIMTPEAEARLDDFVDLYAIWYANNTCADWAQAGTKYVAGEDLNSEEFGLFGTPRELEETIDKKNKLDEASQP